MNTTTTSGTASETAPGSVNTIAAWDHLEDTVDRLAHVVDDLLARHDEQLVCSLQFPEAEALAEVLDAGRHTRTAARLMHHWALTEPDWEADRNHEPTIRGWLALDRQSWSSEAQRPSHAHEVRSSHGA
ncbi:hypothetical protein ACFVSU_07710 [Microbacterium sp. NPDC058062]|uniref:hypothetical protein n=1 Tax=Microbacterium sp. NPDC058062 TaxID=3346320 RepID=UPI0036D8CFC9